MMNQTASEQFSGNLLDGLLADVAIRIQLSQPNYQKAVSRYQSVNDWVERDESPLKDRVILFYPQGSMEIGATIASKLRTDEFDIDVVAELDLSSNVPPHIPLNLLYEAVRGKPGSRYRQMVERKTRCVTVHYSDDMHLDVTPAVRMGGMPERQSLIFHHRPETPGKPGDRIIANPYGFAKWFKENTPFDHVFADFFERRAMKYGSQVFGKADIDPVPPQEPLFRKSKAVIVLQLLKRWRNVQYDSRATRRPPSIMIAKLVADAANHTECLSDELLFQAEQILSVFQWYKNRRQLIHIVNPVCEKDVLTDRWPESHKDQALFIDDMEDLVQDVKRLVEGCNLAEMQKIMIRLFGEAPTTEVVRTFTEQMGKEISDGHSRHDLEKGRLIIPGAAVSSTSRPTPEHRFYGTEWRRG